MTPSVAEDIRVIHVDDEPDFADLAREYLERADERITVTPVRSAAEALDLLADRTIDCIVSDYDMPGENGIEFLNEVRADRPDLPFILFTGKGSEEVASEALSAGATDYLQKTGGTDQYELLANRILNAVKQYRVRERAENLDRIRSLLVDINQALVRASNREEIESEVCEIISDAEPYRFAWLGDVESDTAEIKPREWAGIDEGYLDEITVKADESSRGQGPGGTAVRERRVAVAQDVHATPDFEPWREAASERGFRSVAAFPLECNEELHGVLLVYADRAGAFDEDERALLAELGDDIGHAIHHQQVKQQLQLFRQAVEASGHSIYITDPVGAIEYVNPAFEATTGYTADEAIGRNPRMLKSGEHGQDFYRELWETILAGDVWRSEVTNAKNSGETYVVDQTIAPVIDGGGEITHFVAVNADITEQKEREEKLREARDRREALFQNPNNAIIETEFDGDSFVIQATNETFEEIFDFESNSVVGEPVADALVPDEEDAKARYGGIKQQVLDGEGIDTEVRRRSRQGPRVFRLSVFPIDTADGHRGSYEIYTDITETKKHKQQLEALFDNAPVAIAYTEFENGDPIVQDVNSAFQQTFGHDAEAAVGRNLDDLVVSDDSQQEAVEINQQVQTGEQVEMEVRRDTPEGLRDFTLQSVPLRPGESGERSFAIYNDITERKEREERLERYETIIEASGDAVYMIDSEGQFTFVNDALSNITGYPESELIGEHVSKVMTEEDVENGTSLILELLDSDKTRGKFELTANTADGDEIPMENHIAVITDEDGSLQASAGIVRDISERKAREQRLERFTSLVSHDLRNPLSVAGGGLKLAREDCESDQLDRVAGALDRMETMIDELLTWAQMGERIESQEPVDLSTVVERCWQTVPTANAQLRSVADLTMTAERSRLRQLLENLLRNAVEHGGETVTITVDTLADENGFYIGDDGPGIPDGERNDIFKSGYSREDDGTGLGLAIVREIVDAHGWDICVTDSEAGGARFEISGVEIAE